MMFGLTRKETYILLIALAMVICLPADVFAAFDSLKASGQTIFTGLRKVIYPASAIGIICICIGGFFGNINWKWLLAVVVGLIVISGCATLVELFVGEDGGIPHGSMDGA